jgi:hypothetical protein
MYKAKIRMLPAITALLIGISSLFSSGCGSKLHGFAHPHSDVTAPTFCLHEGDAQDKNAPPVPIYRISVLQDNSKRGNQRLEWRNWRLWRQRDGRRGFIDEVAWEMEYGDPSAEARLARYTDHVAWVIEYAPDPEAQPSPRPFSCITYGKVPPGYDEKVAAAPLIPERLYVVLLEPQEVTARGGMYFIIRLDSTGHPTQLEYTIKPTRLDHVRGVTQQR